MAVWPRQARLQLVPGRGAIAVVAVFAAALVLLAVVHREPGSRAQPSHDRAVQAVLDDAALRSYLGEAGFTRERVTPIDDRLVRVSFFDGPRIVLDAAVSPSGRVTNQILYRPGYVRIGGEVAQRPLVLALLVALFVLAAAGAPVRTLRNLDVLALASFALPVVLMNERLLEASVYVSYPPLAYLCVRCARVAFRPAEARPAAPLVRMQPRMVAIGAAAAATAFVLLAIPGGLVGDVAFASMAGATGLLHGTLPYGHLTQSELVHGDTYPLLAYAAYIPGALISPVRTAFDGLDAALWVATGFALVAAAGMYRASGGRAVLAWLSFPPVLIAASAGSNDLVAAACVAWAVALAAHAGRSAGALTLAGLVKLAPFVALPVWLARYRRRGLVRALLATVLALIGAAVWIVLLGGPSGLGDMARAISFQAERGSLLSLWTLTGADAAQVAVQAAVATLLVAGAVRVWIDRELAADPRRVAALAAAVLLGVQIAANYWTYAYLPWVFPLLAYALLAERRATS